MHQEQLLETMRYWVQQRMRANLQIVPGLFTQEVANAEALNIVVQLEEMPDKFKLTSKWILFIS
jgi:hypothetical protein